MSFATKLRQLRLERDMSLQEFADLLGTTKQVLSRYELGTRTPKVTMVVKFAKALNIPISELTDTDDNVIPEHEPDPVMEEIQDILSSMSPEQLEQASSLLKWIKSGH